jgi:hypothetical protein
MPDGWYAVSSPIITSKWSAPSGQRSRPVGRDVGKIFKIANQPMKRVLAGIQLCCPSKSRSTRILHSLKGFEFAQR